MKKQNMKKLKSSKTYNTREEKQQRGKHLLLLHLIKPKCKT